MVELNYTKGIGKGWRNQGNFIMTEAPNKRQLIAKVENNPEFDVHEVIANSWLIASAPDMYEALKAIKASVIVNGDMSVSYAIDGNIRKLITQALNKAEGK